MNQLRPGGLHNLRDALVQCAHHADLVQDGKRVDAAGHCRPEELQALGLFDAALASRMLGGGDVHRLDAEGALEADDFPGTERVAIVVRQGVIENVENLHDSRFRTPRWIACRAEVAPQTIILCL